MFILTDTVLKIEMLSNLFERLDFFFYRKIEYKQTTNIINISQIQKL